MAEKRKLYARLDETGQPALFYVEGGKPRKVNKQEWICLMDEIDAQVGEMPVVELVPEPRKDFELLGDFIMRLQSVIASEGDLFVTTWDSDHSTWCDDPERIQLDVVDNTDGLGGLVIERIPHSVFLGIR